MCARGLLLCYNLSMILPEPEFLDIFGFIGFIYITVLALMQLQGKKVPKIGFILLLIVGLLGVIIDGLIVYLYFLK